LIPTYLHFSQVGKPILDSSPSKRCRPTTLEVLEMGSDTTKVWKMPKGSQKEQALWESLHTGGHGGGASGGAGGTGWDLGVVRNGFSDLTKEQES